MTSIATVTGNPWLVAASALSGGDSKPILKFEKGDWLLGQDKQDVSNGTLVAVNMASIEWGWVRWSDNRPTDRRMGLIDEGYRVEARPALGDTDESMWPRDDTGRPRDPWQKMIEIPVRELAGERREMLLSGGSRGWEGACKALFDAYGKGLKEGKAGKTPIVKLGSSHYDHKSYGRVKVPVLELVEWREPGELLAAPAKGSKTKF
jgi:hypothetical protein